MPLQPTGLGLGLPYWRGWAPRELVALAEDAATMGYGSVWASEVAGPDPFVLLGGVALRVPGLHLGTALAQAPARSPAAAAAAAATLAGLAGGGVTLGVGVSTRAIAKNWHGGDYPPPTEGLREYIETAREVLDGRATSGRGRHHVSSGYRSGVAPVAVRIIAGALSDRMIRAASRCADGVVLGNVGPRTARAKAELARESADDPALPVLVLVRACVTAQPDQAVEWMRRELVRYCGAPAYQRLFRASGHDRSIDAVLARLADRDMPGARAALDPALVHEVAAIGIAEEVQQRVRQYEAAGASVIVVPFGGGDPAANARDTLRACAHAVATPR